MKNRLTMTVAAAFVICAGDAIGQAGSGAMVRDAIGFEAPERFAEIPGVVEFTGRMVVRPRQDLYGDDAIRQAGGGLEAFFGRQAAAPIAEARQRLLGDAIEYFGDVDEYVLAVPAGMNENTFAEQLMATGDYQYAEPDWFCYQTITPNDPLYGQQWHHNNMNNPDGWDISTGDLSVIVAIVDTGVDDNHPDLVNRLVPGFNAVQNLAEVNGGLTDDTQTSFGHGTFCAGMAAAHGNNGFGTSGVAWNCSVMPIKVTEGNSRGAFSSDLNQGARWAADNGAQVVNVSFSGVSSSSVQTTGAYVESQGGVYFRSAGNDGQSSLNFEHPAVVVVGATTTSDSRAGFSNTGPGLDLVAPGNNVRCASRGGGSTVSSGTSFSSPAAAGTAALMFSANPTLTPDEVKDILYLTARDLGASGEDNSFGHGIVDTAAALASAVGGGVVIPPQIVQQPVLSAVCEGGTAFLSVTASGSDLEYQWRETFGTPIPGATEAALIFSGAVPADAGFYFCEVFNSAGSVNSDIAQITVDPLPSITQQPQSQTVTEGDPVSFTVAADDTTGFQWRFNGSNIAGETGSTLSINSAELSDAGAYTARVTNSCGSETSVAAQLTVEEVSVDCLADVNGNGVTDPGDFTAWVSAFNAGDLAADQNQNGVLDPGDFTAWVSNFNAGC